MGGKARSNHPDYLTRVEAARVISLIMTNDPNPEHEKVHIAYRRIGAAIAEGTLVAHPVAGGRTKQFYKPDLHRFAQEIFRVDVPAFKLAVKSSNDIHNVETEDENDQLLIQEVSQVISWYEEEILSLEAAASTLRKLIKKYSE